MASAHEVQPLKQGQATNRTAPLQWPYAKLRQPGYAGTGGGAK